MRWPYTVIQELRADLDRKSLLIDDLTGVVRDTKSQLEMESIRNEGFVNALMTKNEVLLERDRNIEMQHKLITDQYERISKMEQELVALATEMASHKCNDYTPNKPGREKKDPYPLLSRSGWRARAEAHSRSTVLTVGDSQKALEDRVAKQGGTV